MYKLILLISAVVEVIGDLYLKLWTEGKSQLWIGIVLYAIGSCGWIYCLKSYSLSKGLVIFTLLNLVIGVLSGVFVLKEQISIKVYLAFSLAFVAILLFES